MSREQYLWGLSNGIGVLTLSGAFWLGLAAWASGFGALLIASAPILIVSGVLLFRNLQLRRRAAAFSPRSLRGAVKGSQSRRIIVGFSGISAMQWVSIAAVGLICSAANHPELIWPLIGLVVSIHFLPLGWLFGVRAYYVLGLGGMAIAAGSMLGLSGGARLISIGLGLGLLTIACATYLIANAEVLASAATGPSSSRAGEG